MPRATDGRGEVAPPPVNGVEGVLTATHDDHARVRKALLPAFSEKSLREQESIVQIYVSHLMDGLHKQVDREPTDFTQWLMWTSFDIIGDLGLCCDKHLVRMADGSRSIRRIIQLSY